MKRWALLSAFLYGLLAVLIIFPLIMIAFPLAFLEGFGDAGRELLKAILSAPGYWAAAFGILALIQFLYLAVPLRVARERPVGRRHWAYLAAASGVLFGALVFGAWCVVTETLFQDKSLESDRMAYGGLATAGVSWIVWGIVFYLVGRRSAAPSRTVRTASDTLLKGSILEILVAVPTHVLARHRDYCCAGFLTFVGLASGLATMLFAYGPGVFFLFAERWGRLTGRPEAFPRPTRLRGHAGDAFAWLVFAGAFLVVCSLPMTVSSSFGHPLLGVEEWQFGLGLIGFLVMCIASLVHAVLAWVRREPRRRLALVLGILAVEFLVWMVWMLPEAAKRIE